MTAAQKIDDMTYEQARDELVLIVAKLEAGAVTLEESLELWERGEALAVRCQHILEGARERVARGDEDPRLDGRRRRRAGGVNEHCLVVGEALVDVVIRPDGARSSGPGDRRRTSRWDSPGSAARRSSSPGSAWTITVA